MPTVTSQNKASFVQRFLNRFMPESQEAPASVRPADRWKDVPFDGLNIYQTDYKTGGMQSLPHVYDSSVLESNITKGINSKSVHESIEPSLIHAIYDATKLDRNLKFSPEDAVAMFMQEGRPDMGANFKSVTEGWKDNPRAVDLHERLTEMGYNPYDAGTAALLLTKQMDATRLSKKYNKDIPWQAVWNGLGKTETGRTGYDYAREYNMNRKNVGANKQALEIIRRHMSEPR